MWTACSLFSALGSSIYIYILRVRKDKWCCSFMNYSNKLNSDAIHWKKMKNFGRQFTSAILSSLFPDWTTDVPTPDMYRAHNAEALPGASSETGTYIVTSLKIPRGTSYNTHRHPYKSSNHSTTDTICFFLSGTWGTFPLELWSRRLSSLENK